MTPTMRAAFAAHAMSRGYTRRIAAAAQLIAQHPDYAVSVSWGKDSVLLLHLAATTLGRVMAVHGRYHPHEELPDIPAVRDAVLRRLDGRVIYAEVRVPGDWEIAERLGYPLWQAETAEHRRLLREIRQTFIERLEDAARAMGATGMMLGLAAHESLGRRYNAAMRGCHYTANGRMPTLAPLQWLQADDVIAYHVQHDLRWLRIYDAADDPRKARSELSMATGADAMGRKYEIMAQIEAVYHGHLAPWIARWPQYMR